MLRSQPMRESAIFVGIAFLLAIAVAVALPHADLAPVMSVFLPTLSLAIMTFTVIPRGRRKALWASLGLQRAGLRWWPAALIIPVILLGIAYGTAIVMGVAEVRDPSGLAAWLQADGLAVLINALTGVLFILGEEVGWRGFLLPRIQTLLSRRPAALVTGFIHGCFHLPLILLTTTYDSDGSRWIVAPMVVLVITGAGVFYAWLWDGSGSSWTVAIAHNMANTVFGVGAMATVAASPAALAYVAGESGLATFGAVWLVAGVLLLISSQRQGAPHVKVPTREPALKH